MISSSRSSFQATRTLLADGIHAGEVLLGHRLVDDDAILTVGRVVLVEQSSLQQGNAHGLEVVVVTTRTSATGSSPRAGGGWPTTSKPVAAPSPRSGRKLTAAGRLDAGQRVDAVEQPTGRTARAPRVVRYRDPGSDTRIVIVLRRVEPGIDVQQLHEAADEQAGADEQHQRQRDLDDDERAARAAAACRGSGAPAFLQRVVETAGPTRSARGPGRRRVRTTSDAPTVNPSTQPSMPTISSR